MHPAMALQLSCSALAVGGRGVCRVVSLPATSMVVFVAGALPGELLEARVSSVHARFAEAELESVSRPSPDRVSPPCPLSGSCGGCQLLHLSYTAQLAAKGQLVAESLARVGSFADTSSLVRSPLASPSALRYRNKMEFTVAPGPVAGPPLVGLQRAGSAELVDVPSCPLQSEAADAVLATVRAYLAAHATQLPAFDAASGRGLVRRLMLRTSAAGVQVDVLVSSEAQASDAALARLAAHLAARHPEVVSVVSTLLPPLPPSQPAHGGRRRAPPPPPPREATRTLHGSATLPMSLGGVSFDVSSRSFFQVNPSQAERLLGIVRSAACLVSDGDAPASVLDLFCGTGALSLPLLAACPGATLLGVDASPSAVADAGAAARSAGLGGRAKFRVANLSDRKALVQKWLLEGEKGKGYDVLLVDPARAGLAPPMVSFLRAARAKRLVYVSCDPGTLARDLRALCAEDGADGDRAWILESVSPVDMFPQTFHCEAVASLIRG